jgi:hypothetical protein
MHQPGEETFWHFFASKIEEDRLGTIVDRPVRGTDGKSS